VEVAPAWSPHGAATGQAMLLIVLKGCGKMRMGESMMPMRAGQVWLVNGAQPLELSSELGGDGLALGMALLPVNLLDERSMFDFIETPHVYDAAGTELFTGAIPELLRESAQGGPGSDAIVICLIRRLVTALVRNAWPNTHQIPSAKLSAQGQQFQKIVDLMNKDPARRYTLDNLAATAGMSRTVFHRTFNETHGVSPLSMLRKFRLRGQSRYCDRLICQSKPLRPGSATKVAVISCNPSKTLMASILRATAKTARLRVKRRWLRGLTELACSTAASADVFATKLAHGPRNRILLGINAQTG
jgi:hypothetical protein